MKFGFFELVTFGLILFFTVGKKYFQLEKGKGIIQVLILYLAARAIFGAVFTLAPAIFIFNSNMNAETAMGLLLAPEFYIGLSFVVFGAMDISMPYNGYLLAEGIFKLLAIAWIFNHLFKKYGGQTAAETELAARWKDLEAKHNG